MSSHPDAAVSEKLLDTVRRFFLDTGVHKSYWIAYSGGLDSHVLLSLCHRLQRELSLKLTIIHIDHNLNSKSSAWSMHCETIARYCGIHFISRTINLDNTQQNIEETARLARYAVFADYIAKDHVLLTAHQADDQAETVLLQLLRGAGPKGLAAMPVLKPFAQGLQGRPLLSIDRTDIERYANTERLQWIHDDSNDNTQFARNYLRHDIMPTLKKRWPTINKTLARTAAHCAAADQLLETFAESLLKDARGSCDTSLSVKKLLTFAKDKQQLIIRSWLNHLGYSLPNTKKLHTILQTVLKAAADRFPNVSWGDVEVRRFRDDLYVMKSLSAHDHQQIYHWDLKAPLSIPTIGTLEDKQLTSLLNPRIQAVTVRFRQGGECLNIAKRGRRTLKNLFNEWAIPPWERDRIPLIYVDDKLICVLGFAVDPDYAA